MKTGTVFLVGAGPGDPALLTEQGKTCLEQADVVVYDALACSSVLNLTRPDCELIFAGKTAGNHHKKQSETNQLLAELAQQGKRVVRLKGGDPFVFGRGGEEAQVLQSLGIPFQIVSGVSSCYSVPAYAGIPVTHREYAPAFHVITGHRKTEQHTELDYATLAKLDGTLVFLMSLSNLPAIAASLIQQGKSPDTPAAVIQRGTTARQRVVTAPLSEIAAEVQRQGIHTPAMTVIGDVVSLRQQLSWFGMGELSGKKVLLTGTPAYTRKAAEQLRFCGAEPVEVSPDLPEGFFAGRAEGVALAVVYVGSAHQCQRRGTTVCIAEAIPCRPPAAAASAFCCHWKRHGTGTGGILAFSWTVCRSTSTAAVWQRH